MTSFRHILLISFMTFIPVISFKHFDFYLMYYTYYTYNTYLYYGQVRQDLGLADHVWQDKWAAIAKTIDDLGDQFRPAMRAIWLSYIRQAYKDNTAPAAGQPVMQGTLVVPD